mgnify:CR=1 FL=1
MKFFKLILIFTIISCSKEEKFELPYFTTSDFTPHWINSKSIQDNTHKISDFKLINQNNKEITRENLKGNIVIGVCNFAEKNIAGVISQALILGAIDKEGKVILVHPSEEAENGLPIA